MPSSQPLSATETASSENGAPQTALAACPVCGGAADTGYGWTRDDIAQHLERMYGAPIPADANPVDYRMMTCRDCGLGFADPMTAGNDAFYKWITAFDSYHHGRRWEWRHIAALLRARGGELRLLEIGCGGGQLLAQLSDIPGVVAVGADTAEGSVQTARARGLKVHHCDIDSLARVVGEHRFDAVILSHVLEHLDGPRRRLGEIARLLAPGGSIYVCVPYSPISTELIADSAANLPPHHLSRWNASSLTRLGQETGLAVRLFLPKPKSPFKRAVRATWIAASGGDPHVPPRLSPGRRIARVIAHPGLLFKFARRAYGRERVNGRRAGDAVLAVFTAG